MSEIMKQESIKNKNDFFRKNLGYLEYPGRLILSFEVKLLAQEDRGKLLKKVSSFNDLTEENDPYGEHDFGTVKHGGYEYFFKFEYHDESLTFFKEDGVRILHIMRADEY